jgi:hypothetical protein
MEPVRPGLVDRAHLLAETGEVGGQDRRRDQDVGTHEASSLRALSGSISLPISSNSSAA